MNKLFVSYELALTLKEKGFDEPCLAYHRELLGTKEQMFFIDSKNGPFINSKLGESKYNMVAAPLYQQVTDWLRDKHNIHVNTFIGHDENKIWYNLELQPVELGYNYEPHTCDEEAQDTHNEALNKAITEALKFVKC